MSGRGRGSRGRPPKSKAKKASTEVEEDDDDLSKYSKKKTVPATNDKPKPGSSRASRSRAAAAVVDDEKDKVQCSACLSHFTVEAFPAHNVEAHYNIATTTDDKDVKDYKFYTKQLNALAKLKKIITFVCPRLNCTAKYKSILGLSYHLELCGKSKEEIDACMIQCETCQKRFTAANINWHRKSHQQKTLTSDTATLPPEKRRKRKSAMKAMKSMEGMSDDGEEEVDSDRERVVKTKPISSKTVDNDYVEGDEESEQSEEDELPGTAGTMVQIKLENWVYESPMDVFWNETDDLAITDQTVQQKMQSALASGADMVTQALKFLETTKDSDNVWDNPERNLVDPFAKDLIISRNQVQDFPCEETANLYLPGMELSIEFKMKTSKNYEKNSDILSPSKYHRLPWFESEIIACESGEEYFVAHAGGPITSMSWHPCGKYLAISTLKHYMDIPNPKTKQPRQSSVYIYSHISTLTSNSESSIAFDISLIIGLDYGYVNHLQWGNFWPLSCSPYFNDNDRPFTEEESRIGYICCAFEDSTCRIMSIDKQDFQLEPNFTCRENFKVRVYRKVPEIVLAVQESIKHDPGQCLKFDWHEGNRFIVAGYSSGHVAVFDLENKSKLLRRDGFEAGYPITTFYPFWIFQAHKLDVTGVHIDPGSSRYFHTVSLDRHLKSWDIDLRQELECKKIGLALDSCWIRGWIHLAVSTDLAVSSLSSQFNFVRFYQIGSARGHPNYLEYFNLTSIGFHEGMTVEAAENGRLIVTYFDAFWRECDYERSKRKKNAVVVSTIELDEETCIPLTEDCMADQTRMAKATEEPKVILSFVKKRMPALTQPAPHRQTYENLVQYYHLLRVNKVAWCPTGEYLAVGYRNGLLTIMPATFDTIYNSKL